MLDPRKKFFQRAFQDVKNIVHCNVNCSVLWYIQCIEVRQMFWYVFFGFFSAFGVVSALCVLLGLLFSGKGPCTLTLHCPQGRELWILRRVCWLCEMGLLRARLIVLDSGLNQRQQQMICRRYPYITFYSGNRERSAPTNESTGDGDPAGHDCRCGIPEL